MGVVLPVRPRVRPDRSGQTSGLSGWLAFGSPDIKSMLRKTEMTTSFALDNRRALIFILSNTEIPLCEVNVHFPGRFAPINLANKQRPIQCCMGKLLARIEREILYICVSVKDEEKSCACVCATWMSMVLWRNKNFTFNNYFTNHTWGGHNLIPVLR